MKIEVIDTDRAARSSSPLSQAIKVGKTIYISGQLGKNPTTGELASTIEEQTKNALLNMKIIIEEAGGNINDIVKTTIFLKNLDHVSIVNKILTRSLFVVLDCNYGRKGCLILPGARSAPLAASSSSSCSSLVNFYFNLEALNRPSTPRPLKFSNSFKLRKRCSLSSAASSHHYPLSRSSGFWAVSTAH